MATLNTVRVVLLMKARSTTNCRTVITVLMLSHSCQVVGQLKSRFDASCIVLAAVTRMKANGIRKITTEAMTATMPITQPSRAFALHEFLSRRPRRMLIGTMMAATIRNRITLPAVDRP